MKTPLNRLSLGRDNWDTFEQSMTREWLVTNGIGGFACGTVGGTSTRRYHGLLLAALAPPVNRTLLVADLDVTVHYGSSQYPFFTHEYADGTVDPHGYLQLESFHLDDGVPVWCYAVADALVEKRVLMAPLKNTTYVDFTVLRASAALEFEWTPLCTYRDYHSHSRGGWDVGVRAIRDGVEIDAFPGARSYRVTCVGATFEHDPAWHWNFRHRTENARGLDDREDLFRPGRFTLHLRQGEKATIVFSAEPDTPQAIGRVQAQVQEQKTVLLENIPVDAPDWVRPLTLAADQFIVDRYQGGAPAGKTIIAGYPWFSDWGRDTMIALPGLTLATQRFGVAASILRTFAAHISEGMLPNRFPDSTETPEYNTVDATLWYFQAVDQYTRSSGDFALAAELYPLLSDIIDWHIRGTRYGIHIDTEDGLLTAGEANVQLTWMDARIGDRVVTARVGKAVEVNALWYNALQIMATLAIRQGEDAQSLEYKATAAQVKTGFQRFWNMARGCLYDVIDGPEGEAGPDGRNYDNRLRPNQLFAVSLPHSPLEPAQQKSIVDLCARELLTSHGLRSLAPGEPGYVEHYQGGPLQRDSAYHQGTVWAWLIGPFVDAHYRVYQDAVMAGSFLEPFGLHLSAACVGSISEVFDADPPFTPGGCFAQAWSVSEVLRVWWELYRRQHDPA
ncbi:MAG: amylo-alpha-1,6-glucosidase [Thiogranum sp.]|nr:amylo-alpha-1,6-glucosidase [Thiogranum sp.]